MSPVLSVLIVLPALVGIALMKNRFIGFASQKPADFASKGPAFDPRLHPAGPILGEGVVYGPGGRASSRSVADMRGDWTGSTGVLTERFRHDSGTVQDRQWTPRLGEGGTIAAEAPDVLGFGLGQAPSANFPRVFSWLFRGANFLLDWAYCRTLGASKARKNPSIPPRSAQ